MRLLQHTQIVVYLLDLLLDKSAAIRQMSDRCLDVVIETDEVWAAQIRQRESSTHGTDFPIARAGAPLLQGAVVLCRTPCTPPLAPHPLHPHSNHIAIT